MRDRIRVSQVYPYTLVGIEEVTEESNTYLSTMRCVSQVAKTFAISKSNFETILREKCLLVHSKMFILSAKSENRVLDLIEKRG